ncbi:DUF4352 domain-containing protein [Nesterenkonia halotolerans]|uniref:DUF4352 domain-containing protein n=1 Tax=Nesterenkonia halotolerans TaxID=225325 RepID=A0ABR9J8F0_9MICC|nr:hypothetical protein [Nesterenkonia halotolerans]MBE1515185.1 hypothetical protein [Nesterenkonia halotolerans]
MSHARISISLGLLICTGTLIVGCSETTGEEDVGQESPVDQESDSSSPETDSPEPDTVTEGEGGGESGDPGEIEEREPVAERLNERGNLPMPEHNPYYLLSPEDDSAIAEFDISDLQTDVVCTSSIAPESTESFLQIDLDVSVENDARNFIPDGAILTTNLFQVLDSDGSIVDTDPGSGEASYSCLPEEEVFPFGSIRPGTSGSGSFVFEPSVESGYVVFHEVLSDTYLEWEFDLR